MVLEIASFGLARTIIVNPSLSTRRAWVTFMQTHRDRLENEGGPLRSQSQQGWVLEDDFIGSDVSIFIAYFRSHLCGPIGFSSFNNYTNTP